MKRILLTQGKFALVDDEDFEFLNQWKWYFSKGYAARDTGGRKNKTTIWMHRMINNTPVGLETDHINRDKVDNRKSNLRSVTKSQNGLNRSKYKNNKSGILGVYWENWSSKWRAEIRVNNKKIRLGRFLNIKDALAARKVAEQLYAN